MKETIMNQEKLAKLQAQVRIGGKVGAASPPRPGGRLSLHARQARREGSSEPGWGAAGSTPLCSGEAALLQGSLERVP